MDIKKLIIHPPKGANVEYQIQDISISIYKIMREIKRSTFEEMYKIMKHAEKQYIKDAIAKLAKFGKISIEESPTAASKTLGDAKRTTIKFIE